MSLYVIVSYFPAMIFWLLWLQREHQAVTKKRYGLVTSNRVQYCDRWSCKYFSAVSFCIL